MIDYIRMNSFKVKDIRFKFKQNKMYLTSKILQHKFYYDLLMMFPNNFYAIWKQQLVESNKLDKF